MSQKRSGLQCVGEELAFTDEINNFSYQRPETHHFHIKLPQNR